MWLGNIGTNTTGDMLSPRSIGQFMIFGFTFAQSMVQPIQNALHLYKTDSILFEMGVKLLELYGILQTLKVEAKKQGLQMHISETLSELEGLDPRRAFLLIKEDPERLHMAFRDLAQLEIVWRIAKTDYLNTVIFHPTVFQIRDMVDVSLTNGVPSSITLSTNTERHAILTGPNGGGKSSVLRGILQSVLLAHTYGVAPAVDAIMPRFRWIASGLQLRDTPGVYSMFETEVKFAAECIRSGSPEGMGLVLFDELFHSTNPPDGTRSAKLFLEQLWTSNVFSIVSTHVFPLVEDRPGHVRAICCAASEKPDGDIQYSYRAEPGICKVSSVHKVWEKYGLRRAAHNPMAKSL
jgi:DNA mismatch repair ATPase MutS